MTKENRKDKLTHIAVQIPASLGLIMWAVLLNIPKSKARKIKIAAIKSIQTVIVQ
jgi:hypothetical protein